MLEQEPPTVVGVATLPSDREADMADVDYDLVVVGGGRCVDGTKQRRMAVGWNGGRTRRKERKIPGNTTGVRRPTTSMVGRNVVDKRKRDADESERNVERTRITAEA